MAHERLAEQQLESFLADAEGYADRLLRPAGESQKMMAARRDVLLRRLNIIKKLHQRGVLPVEKMELFYLERTLREGAPGILSLNFPQILTNMSQTPSSLASF